MASAAQWLLLLATSLLHLADAAHAFRYAPLTITSPPEPYQTHPHYVYDLARRTTLARRQTETTTANTCGWTSADAKKPATCPIGQGCGWWHGTVPSENGVVCVPFDSSGDWEWNAAPLPTLCWDFGTKNYTADVAFSTTISSTLFCGSSSTICATATFDGAPNIFGSSSSLRHRPYTSMFCTDSPIAVAILQSVTNAPTPSSSSSSAPPLSTSPTGRAHNPGGKGGSGASSSSAAAGPTGKHGGGGSNDAGVIAGATVGGVVGLLAIAGVLAFFILRQRKRKQYAPPPEISTVDSNFGSPQGKQSWISSAGSWQGGGEGYSGGGIGHSGGYSDGGQGNWVQHEGQWIQGGRM